MINNNSALRAIFPAVFICIVIITGACNNGRSQGSKGGDSATAAKATPKDSIVKPAVGPLDTALYNKRLAWLANGTILPAVGPSKQPYPNPGAILPFRRIIAYYGNLYSKKMGALGEYPPDEMLRRLKVGS